MALTLVLGLINPISVSAYTLNNGRYIWNFLPGAYNAHYDAQGIPNALDPARRRQFNDGFWTRISASLPEKTDIRLSSPSSITDDNGANLHLIQEADVELTFLHEGAGYRNSIGYFTYDRNHPPSSLAELQEKIVFPNASFTGSGGSAKGLASGDTLKLGRFPAGTSIGFVLVSNGFDSGTGVKNLPDSNWIFTTLRDLNSETDPLLRRHTVLLYDTDTQQAVLGLEDMLRSVNGCDHDFNDVILTLSANPPEAVDSSAINPLPEARDSDTDGVLDAHDEFPQDSARAFHQYYPEQGQRSTLAFEDNWPAQGDYDLNDLVVRYSFDQVTDSQGRLKDISADFELTARGADLHNTFALAIPGIDPNNLVHAEIIHEGQSTALQPETGHKQLVLKLADDVTTLLPPTGNNCRFFNTLPTCTTRQGYQFKLQLSLKNPVSKTLTGLPPYNPFIYRKDQRGYEIHLPNHPPTDRAAKYLLGTRDDASTASTGQYYKTRANLPWALDIVSNWSYPAEQAEVSSAYLDFKTWAESKGSLKPDWFRQGQSHLLWAR